MSAPAPGTLICESGAVPEGGTYSVDLDGFPILLVRRGGSVHAYLNACPHQFLPLDYRSQTVVSADGTQLLCTNHGAGFDLETGAGMSGFGQGCALERVVVEEADGAIRAA